MPKVSVIIPVYNVEQYIERCASDDRVDSKMLSRLYEKAIATSSDMVICKKLFKEFACNQVKNNVDLIIAFLTSKHLEDSYRKEIPLKKKISYLLSYLRSDSYYRLLYSKFHK